MRQYTAAMGGDGFTFRSGRADEIEVIAAIDDDATALFTRAGLDFSALTPAHPYVHAERAGWMESARRGWLQLALDGAGEPVAFMALATLDGAPYLDQLSVRVRAMRKGIGQHFVREALRWAAARSDCLWLTTYAHLGWNRPYYERFGFEVVAEAQCGPQMQECLVEQRSVLPAPAHRVAMRHRLADQHAGSNATQASHER